MIPLIGYVDRLSARPGERIAVKVSSQLDRPYLADLVRIIHADANPAGPGIKLAGLPAAFAGTYPSRFQPVHPGSCGVVMPAKPLALPDPCTIVLRVQPWMLRRPCWRSKVDRLSLSLPRVHAWSWATAESAPMVKARWYELRVIAGDGRIRLRQTALQRSWGVDDTGEAEMTGKLGALAKLTFVAASTAAPRPHDNPYCAFFNGRLEDPAILIGAHDGPEPLEPDKAKCLAWWDFSAEIPTDRIIDRGPHGMHGHLRNLPTRAVRGSHWTGEDTNWRHMPRHYAAIHFHQDDLYDCDWETDFVFEVPDGMASGVYGIRLRCDDAEEIVPIYVLPRAGSATAPIVLPRPSLIRSMATISAAMSTTPFVRGRPNGMPIRGMPTSIPNTARQPTTGIPTAEASAIRACAGPC